MMARDDLTMVAMTPRQRWLAALHFQPIDRLPFWPKLNAAYPRVQSSAFRDMEVEAPHDWTGSDKHMHIPGCVREVRSRTSIQTSRANGVTRTVFRTPRKEMELAQVLDEPSQSWHPMEFPVRTIEDVRPMAELFEDVKVALDGEGLKRAKGQAAGIGESAVTADCIGESPLMHWVGG